MTQFLKLLLIAAIALPSWHAATAQEMLRSERVAAKAEFKQAKDVAMDKADLGASVSKDTKSQQLQKAPGAKTIQDGITVCDGTTTDGYFPVYGLYFDYGTSSQMIYPAALLTDIPAGSVITSLVFYATGDLNEKLSNSTVTLRLGETNATTVTSSDAMSSNRPSTVAFQGVIATGTGSNPLTITLSTPYTYQGGNLIVDFVVSAGGSGNYSSTSWYGVSATNASYCIYGSGNSAHQGDFLPKMTVNYYYEPDEPYAAALSGDGEFGQVNRYQTETRTFTVKNLGENAFTPVMTITGDEVFAVSSAESGTLASGATRTYNVSFSPTALHEYSATLTLTAQEAEASAISATAQLSGTGSRLQNVPVADGSDVNGFVPVYLYYLEQANHGQIIYPASELGLNPGSKISSITFHANSNLTATSGSSDATVTLKLGETANETYSSTTFLTSGLTTVASLSSILTGTTTVTFTFDAPYEYQGGNLIVDVSCGDEGTSYTSSSVKWLGKSSDGSSIHTYGSNSATQQNFLPKMTMKVEKAAGEETHDLDFGMINVGSSKTLNANIANPSDEPVTATVTVSPNPPFSVASGTVTLAPSSEGTTSIPVTFTPTGAASYHGTLTITAGDVVKTVTLMGMGNLSGPEAVRDSAFFHGIEYTWEEYGTGATHTNNLAEIATDPDQIIAMLREVYMNKNIPGNFKRGYKTNGNSEPFDDVHYPGIGSITHSGSSYNSASYYSYNDARGWSIPGDIKMKTISYFNGNATAYCAYMDSTQYKPNQEGVTLLLLEMQDGFNGGNTTAITSYSTLRDYISTCVKSARVVTQAKRTGTGQDRGTLFKIDCDKMNKFFLLAKGQLRWFNDAYFAKYVRNNTEYIFGNNSGYQIGTPCYLYSYYSGEAVMNQYYEDYSTGPFYHMFEQFSPVSDDATAAKSDIYQDLINMQSFGVEHDCMGVTHMGHQFQMYGDDSEAADCQDVRDMMFFVPDYRMMYWENLTDTIGRDVVYDDLSVADTQKYRNYNLDHQPTMGLYVIRQNDITGEQVNGEETYKLHLTWTSNLLDFLPGEDAQYDLYRVITNPDGTKTYQKVGEFDPNTFAYDDYVPMLESGQQVTYVVQGQDVGKFLSLQMSNEESYLIPGLDPSEMVMLDDATYYSRYNPQTEKNCYSNKLVLTNNAMGLNNNNITGSTQLTFNRIHSEMVDGVSTTITEPVATITFNAGSKTMTVTMDNQSPSSEYPNGRTSGTAAGYHANLGTNSWTQSYTVASTGSNAGNLIFTLSIFDNFTVDVSKNEHPASYTYSVESNYDAASSSTSVYLNAANCTTGEEVWYAWTWNNDNDGKWVQGIAHENLLKFVAVKNNMLFIRMNAHPEDTTIVLPDWRAEWNRTPVTVSTVGNIGKTYTIGWYDDNSGNIWGQWSNDVMPEYAHSNSIRVPVYKTGSQMTAFTEQQVLDDEDGYMELPDKVIFDVNVQGNSKTELLRYDAYRWKNTAATERFIIDTVDGDDEEDIAPNGVAANQGVNYTVSMNAVGTDDYITSTASLTNGWGVAHFEDVVPAKNTTAAIFDYAPVAETFASAFDKNREDYNTYGGPMQSTATGEVEIEVVTPSTAYPLMSNYTWTADGKKYAYYNINVNVYTKELPEGYDIYMIRAWREVDESILGEEYEEAAGRLSDDVLFEEIKYPDYDKNSNYILGSGREDISVAGHGDILSYRGTFGAQKLRTAADGTSDDVIDELTALFTIRIYFTKNENLPDASKLRDGTAGDGKFYVVERVVEKTFKTSDVVTGVIDNFDTRQVAGVKYYNMAGIESDQPFDGVNIVVTRYTDGSTSTTKVIK